MVGAAAVGLVAPAARPVARATQGANARAARSVRVGAVAPGVSSRSAPGLRHRPVRGRCCHRRRGSSGTLRFLLQRARLANELPPQARLRDTQLVQCWLTQPVVH